MRFLTNQLNLMERAFVEWFNVSHEFDTAKQVNMKILNLMSSEKQGLDIYLGKTVGKFHKLSKIELVQKEMQWNYEWIELIFCMPPGPHTIIFAYTMIEEITYTDPGIGSIQVQDKNCTPEVFEQGR